MRHFQYDTSCKTARALDAAWMSRGIELGNESGDQRLPSRLEPPV
jgi:hypothetical protein